MSRPLHEISVISENISDQLKFNSLLKEYLFHKQRYDRGVYGPAVTKYDLAGIRLTCSLLYSDMKALNPDRTFIEVPDLKIHS